MNTPGTAGTSLPRPGEEPPDEGRRADLIVIGSGIAGLRAAIAAAAAGLEVVLLAKDPASDSNTDKAQGGIAVALSDEDEVGLHYRDTIAAGTGLCDERAVQMMVGEGPRLITELIGWGASFDRDGARLAFTREGAHSARRVLHAGGDSTGQEILRTLIERARSERRLAFGQGAYTVDILTEGSRCAGVTCLDSATGRLTTLRGRVLLATGGCGQVYRETTNPPQATGDGIAMAWRAGAWVRDMEFVQFHPTALSLPGAPRFLLSEALRGEGGILRDHSGRRFMLDVDPERAELAPRDLVARAIAGEMEETGESSVLLDMTGLDPDFVRSRFPRIHSTCLGFGIDISKEPIPVSPSAHYMMGGVATDLRGRTSLPGLYAAGETACTGVHGANRLASNSLLEGLVFGARAGEGVAADASDTGSHERWFDPAPSARETPATWSGRLGSWPLSVAVESSAKLVAEVRSLAWSRAGLNRDGSSLGEGLVQLGRLLSSAGPGAPTRAGVEARNLHLVASLIVRAAFDRRESRGAHFRRDFPERDDARFRLSLLLRADGGRRALEVA